MKIHEIYINRCLELAKNGFGTTYPNPMVGCVIVYNDTIIGEGWHKKSGEAHAEVNAINSVKDKPLLSKSTIYVSLEPCSHYGKTPPCSDLIIKNKIPNVVVGTIDTNSKVAGNGIKKLKEHGINVIVGVLEKQCFDLNKRFFTFHNKKRPYIILKWAESKDGFIAPNKILRQAQDDKKPVWISNEYSRQLVHKWRSEEQAILVGTKTVLDDNPKLNVRDWTGENPIRIVLDREGKISDIYAVKDNTVKTIIFTESDGFIDTEKKNYQKIRFNENLGLSICEILYKFEIQSIIIEGGKQTLETFIKQNLWDEARVFVGAIFLNYGIKAPEITGKSQITKINNDELKLFFNND